jgi:hypothetical protein
LEPSLKSAFGKKGLIMNLEKKIEAAKALPAAAKNQLLASRILRSRPTLSLPQVAEVLRICSNDPSAESSFFKMSDGKWLRAAPVVPSAAVRAIYSVGDARETAYLCQIAKVPELASSFVAAKTPIAKVRAALTQRADQAIALRPAPKPITTPEASAPPWDEVVAKVNAENARSPSSAPAKADPWAEIVSDINAKNAQSGSPTRLPVWRRAPGVLGVGLGAGGATAGWCFPLPAVALHFRRSQR